MSYLRVGYHTCVCLVFTCIMLTNPLWPSRISTALSYRIVSSLCWPCIPSHYLIEHNLNESYLIRSGLVWSDHIISQPFIYSLIFYDASWPYPVSFYHLYQNILSISYTIPSYRILPGHILPCFVLTRLIVFLIVTIQFFLIISYLSWQILSYPVLYCLILCYHISYRGAFV